MRNTAAGLRYTIYVYMTDLHDLTKVIYKPAGYLIAPQGEEYVGDVSNVAFSNGWILDDDGETLFIYYASSDTRMHVATTTIAQMLDYVMNNPPDGLRSSTSVNTLVGIIKKQGLPGSSIVDFGPGWSANEQPGCVAHLYFVIRCSAQLLCFYASIAANISTGATARTQQHS